VGKLSIQHLLDRWRRKPLPTASELLELFTETVYFCANFNATAVASAQYKLYVPEATKNVDKRFGAKTVSREQRAWMETQPVLRKSLEGKELTEITEHPALTLLFESPSSMFEGFELIWLAQLYREIIGQSVWQLGKDGLRGTPSSIWTVPGHKIEPVLDDSKILTGYRVMGSREVIPLEELVVLRTPHLQSPYTKVWSPCLAAARSAGLLDLDLGLAFSFMLSRARPDVWISPKEDGGLGEDEADRMQNSIKKIYHQGGDGGVVITDTPLDITSIGYSMREMDQIKRVGVHADRIFNIFGVPLALGTTKTNLANLKAAMIQFARFTLTPRLTTFCQTVTRQYIRHFDARAFLWFENPVPEDVELKIKVRESYLKTGQRVVNEYRDEDGLEPVAWGDKPHVATVPAEGNEEGEPEGERKKAWWEDHVTVGPTE
jgi:phage portal protein BeeE